MKIIRYIVVFVAIVTWLLPAFADGEMSLRLDEELGRTGRYLTGVHFVYSYERDAFYENDSFAKWARRAGVTVARYPGGTVVKYWDWRNPTGHMMGDPWDDPAPERAPPSNWMSLDEYLHFVRVSGVAPLIGINLLSGVRHDRVEDSVARAVDQVKYVVSKGYEGAFYYLGNEDMAKMGGLEETARIFVRHAREMKRVDPSAKLFWNDDFISETRLRRFLAIAGEYADGVEFHGKWPYGGEGRQQKIRLADWQQHYPFRMEKWGQFSERALALRRYASKLGYPNLMFANNEYGLGHGKFIGFDRYEFGLVAIEFLQDIFIGQVDMAAFWTTVPERTPGAARRLINTGAGNRLNPLHFGLEMLSSAQGKRLVRIEGGGPDGYGFGALSDERLEIFLLNKSSTNSGVSIRVRGGGSKIGSTGVITSLVDTPDHWGKLVEAPVRIESESIHAVLPPLSYSKIVLRGVRLVTH